MKDVSLLFIPDISGFTKFVTRTELTHSNHIITELIEVIINCNLLDLNISEIEGDAVLFYLPGEPPALANIIRQSKKMFMDFHAHLSEMERGIVCKCGACATISHLTLKFITHYGVCREVAIQKFTKLIGSDVILAHKLLKNAVPETEYLLLSDHYLNTQQLTLPPKEEWIVLKPHSEIIQDFGRIDAHYIPLTPLRALVA